MDIHRPHSSKDDSGWRGPVRVVAEKPEAGQAIVPLNNRDLPCRVQEVRHTLPVFFDLEASIFQDFSQPMTVVAQYVASLDAGIIRTFGLTDSQGAGMVTTRDARDEPRGSAGPDLPGPQLPWDCRRHRSAAGVGPPTPS